MQFISSRPRRQSARHGTTYDPARIIAALARIDDEGLLDDLWIAFAAASRGPRDDMERYPLAGPLVERYVAIAQDMLGGSAAEWRQAAREALLPETRQSVAMEIIDEFEQRVDEARVAASVDAKLSRGRRR